MLFVVSIELLTHGGWRVSGDGSNIGSVPGELGIIPLAFPLLTGHGAITTVIISFEAFSLIVTIVSIIIVELITYLVLLENPLLKILGRRGSLLITRVFAVFIAAIAIQYIIQGLRQLITM